MGFAFQLFGLRLTTNCSLPGLEPTATRTQTSDLSVCFGSAPPFEIRDSCENSAELFYQSRYRSETGEPAFRTWTVPDRSLMRIKYQDSTEFWIDLRHGKIWADWGERSSFDDAVGYLLGPVLGFLLRMRGVVCLHASAVRCGDGAVAFVGEPGAGKSTTAAAMVQRGHALLADDIVALVERGDEFCAVPAYPMLGLWPEAVEALYGSADSAPASSKNDEKRRVSLNAGQFASRAIPLSAIFILGERQPEVTAAGVERLTAQQALMALVANTYANLLPDEEQRAREFAFLGRLVNSIPVRRVRAQQDVSRIDELCESIENEVASARGPMPMAAQR
jgi:hypothetical protein